MGVITAVFWRLLILTSLRKGQRFIYLACLDTNRLALALSPRHWLGDWLGSHHGRHRLSGFSLVGRVTELCEVKEVQCGDFLLKWSIKRGNTMHLDINKPGGITRAVILGIR